MTDTDKGKRYADILKSMESIKKNLAEVQTTLARRSKRQEEQRKIQTDLYKRNSLPSYKVTKVNNANNIKASRPCDNTVNKISSSINDQFISMNNDTALQLINKKVAEKQLEARIRLQNYLILKNKVIKREAEVQKVKQYLNKNKEKYDYCDWINIYGDNSEVCKRGYGLYAVVHSGNKLVPLSQDPRSKNVGSKVHFDGKIFVRNSRGILTNTEIKTMTQEYCHFFTSTGVCPKKNCTYKHAISHLALCRSFLSNQCLFTEETCRLSHTITQNNVPTCLFFMKGYCKNGSDCKFGHVKTNKNARICRPFTIGGWCSRGLSCPKKHIYDCPDFVDYGICSRGKNCKLAHPRKKVQNEKQQVVSSDIKTIRAQTNEDKHNHKLVKEEKQVSHSNVETFAYISRLLDSVPVKDNSNKLLQNHDDDNEDHILEIDADESEEEEDNAQDVNRNEKEDKAFQQDLEDNQDFVAF